MYVQVQKKGDDPKLLQSYWLTKSLTKSLPTSKIQVSGTKSTTRQPYKLNVKIQVQLHDHKE